MSGVVPLPTQITLPKIPVEVPPPPEWHIVETRTWVHDPIPVEIEFPLYGPKRIALPLRIQIPGVGTFDVRLELNTAENAVQSE